MLSWLTEWCAHIHPADWVSALVRGANTVAMKVEATPRRCESNRSQDITDLCVRSVTYSLPNYPESQTGAREKPPSSSAHRGDQPHVEELLICVLRLL
jgi:hypothetical protein